MVVGNPRDRGGKVTYPHAERFALCGVSFHTQHLVSYHHTAGFWGWQTRFFLTVILKSHQGSRANTELL